MATVVAEPNAADELDARGVYVARGACQAPVCAACLSELVESLERMLALPGRAYDNRHYIRFVLPPGTAPEKEPEHQRDFALPLSPAVEEVLRAVSAGMVGAILLAALGEDAELCEVSLITSEPGAAAQGFHSDGVWGAAAPRLVTMFLALHDVLDEAMGPTRFCPGTHSPQCFPPDNVWLPPPDPYSRPRPRAAEKLAEAPPVWFALNAGDAVLMDSTAWHCGGANTSEERRHLLAVSFVAPAPGGREVALTGSGQPGRRLLLRDFVGC